MATPDPDEEVDPDATPDPAAEADAETAFTINVGEGEFGRHLIDREGFAYYTYRSDEEPEDLGDFEAVEAGEDDTVGTGLDQDRLGTIDRDGIQYLTFNERPLYRYAGDVQPGDTLGHGLDEEWALIGEEGDLIDD
jgi:predicted lipoprotein with Yx(FWY)xxD motif